MEGGGDFTFAVAASLAGAGGRRVGAGLLYPVFGQPRSPPRQRALETETTTATARVPLRELLLVDALRAGAEQQPDGGDKRPVKTCYCSCCPGSPSTASSPARCRKSGSTGSVLRWSQRLLGRSHSGGKENFVFLDASPSNSSSKRKGVRSGGVGGHAHVWSSYAHKGGGNDGRRRSFLPYRQDLVGLFASATAFRRTYHPF
ncbi:hypothetical protein CFC21_013886 [Triticum aestivum]|nr:uncharacterized protein LOC109761946 [Aegilops tauschii subsp. strangulata]XP_044446956.1 uncharacterized protein LOC123177061 [Triticum aestivum]KAF6994115.1 hypothetical protein CFC21_010901 [Triticum aestivum]KAF6997683.1 hypothetical protein CFC21_013886 [Triticum aestivum]